jgi:hypothetical protein
MKVGMVVNRIKEIQLVKSIFPEQHISVALGMYSDSFSKQFAPSLQKNPSSLHAIHPKAINQKYGDENL